MNKKSSLSLRTPAVTFHTMNPDECQAICEYLKAKSYPSALNKNEKRRFRRYAQKFLLLNGDLFYAVKNESHKKVVALENKTQILESCHDDPTGGHLGIEKT